MPLLWKIIKKTIRLRHPKPLGLKQESTDFDVAASELSNPLCSIIDTVTVLNKGKGIMNYELRIGQDDQGKRRK